MRFLFVSAQVPGHLDWGGYLATAAELQRRGHAVLWATGAAMARTVEQAGVPFYALNETGWRWPPPPPLQPDAALTVEDLQLLRAERALNQWLDEGRVTQAIDELVVLGETFQPDLIVSEMFISAAGLAAEVLQKPFAVAGWPATLPQASRNQSIVTMARTRLQRLYEAFQITGQNWTSTGPPALLSPLLHLTYWSPRWYTGVALLPQTRHVGGSAQPPRTAAPFPWTEDDPLVFITLGTSFGHDPNFFVAATQAATALGCLPIVALGGQFTPAQKSALQAQLPESTVITETVDFGAVLPKVAAAIHQGGAGVTHALVTHAVPQIVVPHAADQIHQAQGVVRSGVGLHIPPKQVTVDSLRIALARLLPDLSPMRANAQALQQEFAELGGVPQAANILEVGSKE